MCASSVVSVSFFFFNDTAPTEISPLPLHDALPICPRRALDALWARRAGGPGRARVALRSEEHTSELQSRQYLGCRLLLEKKTQTDHPRFPRVHMPREPATATARRGA